MKQRFRRVTYPLYTFINIQEATEFINTQERNKTSVFLIISGTLGADFVPLVFNNRYVLRIYIYCYKISKHIGWSSAYVEKLKVFDFDAELLIGLTRDIACHLTTMAKDAEKEQEPFRAAGLLDWAAWLYHDALLNERTYYRMLLDSVRKQRQKLNEKHKMSFLDQFNT